MNIKKQPLYDKDQTAIEMKSLVKNFHKDLENIFVKYKGAICSLSKLPFERFHKFVREIPYKMDDKPVELVMRPYYAIKFADKGIDCKKKAILIAAWCENNGIQWRFIASSRRPDKRKHHVFPQVKLSGEWVNADATYRQYRIGQTKKVTASEIL